LKTLFHSFGETLRMLSRQKFWILSIIQSVGPKELYFFGPYAKRYVDEMEDVAPKVRPLYVNDQPTLF
jgi:hypothetical protein